MDTPRKEHPEMHTSTLTPVSQRTDTPTDTETCPYLRDVTPMYAHRDGKQVRIGWYTDDRWYRANIRSFTPVSARSDIVLDTRADPRFNAHTARLRCGWTVEQVYLSARRNQKGEKYPSNHGSIPDCLLINGQLHPYTHKLKHELYLSLWFLYLMENTKLLIEAATYDYFVDTQQENGRKVHWTDSYACYTNTKKQPGCNQAAAIAYMVNRYRCGLLERDPRMSIQDHGGHTQIIYTGNDIVTPWPWLNECIRDAVLAYMGRWMKK